MNSTYKYIADYVSKPTARHPVFCYIGGLGLDLIII